jgi:hypothetical protein
MASAKASSPPSDVQTGVTMRPPESGRKLDGGLDQVGRQEHADVLRELSVEESGVPHGVEPRAHPREERRVDAVRVHPLGRQNAASSSSGGSPSWTPQPIFCGSGGALRGTDAGRGDELPR